MSSTLVMRRTLISSNIAAKRRISHAEATEDGRATTNPDICTGSDRSRMGSGQRHLGDLAVVALAMRRGRASERSGYSAEVVSLGSWRYSSGFAFATRPAFPACNRTVRFLR